MNKPIGFYYDTLNSIYSILKNRKPDKTCYLEILHLLSDSTNKKGMSLYRLDDSDSCFKEVANYMLAHDYPQRFNKNSQRDLSNALLLLNGVDCVIGFIIFDEDTMSENDKAFLKLVRNVLSREFEKVWITQLFSELVKPINLHLSRKEYFSKMCKLAGKSANLKYAAIRIYDEQNEIMECKAAYCKGRKRDSFDLTDLTICSTDNLFNAFYRTMNDPSQKMVRIFNKPTDNVVKDINKFNIFKKAKTVVIAPLVVGNRPIGTVSFGADHYINFTKVQKGGIASISNNVGAAISFYLETRDSLGDMGDKYTELTQTINQDIIQGLRHAAKNDLHTLTGKLTLIDQRLKKKKYADIAKTLEESFLALSSAKKSISDQANISLTAKPKRQKVDLLNLFQSAEDLVRYKLDQKDIDVNKPNNSAYANVDPISIKYAFLNLLLNSAQAFKGQKKRGRKITLTIRDADDRLIIRYSDNASGFQVNANAGILSINDIWKVGKTTKKNGTGYGLPYVRSAIQKINHGTVDIIDYRGGMSFEIQLYK